MRATIERPSPTPGSLVPSAVWAVAGRHRPGAGLVVIAAFTLPVAALA